MLMALALATPLVAQDYNKKDTEKMLKDGAKKMASANAAEREEGASWVSGYIQCPYRKQYEPVLVKALKDPAPKVRVLAASALTKVQATTAIPDLVALIGDPVQDVREAAAIALGGMGVAAASAEPVLKKAHAAARAQRNDVEEGTMMEAMLQIAGKKFPPRRYSCP
jgi:hypothetical protein